MQLRQQIIQDRIDEIAKKLGVSVDEAFLRLSHSLITGQSIHAFAQEDLVDGGEDKQIDTITIEPLSNDEATVYIIQTKNTQSFSSNSLIQMHNGLNWIFNTPKTRLSELSNLKFRDKIMAYRYELSALGPANIHIVVAFVTNGIVGDLSNEFHQEERSINLTY